MTDSSCRVDGCGKPIHVKSRQLCKTCYGRWWKHGDPTRVKITPAGKARAFADQVIAAERTDKCIEWPFVKLPTGYGHFSIAKRTVYAHRYVLEATAGPPPSKKHQAAHEPVVCHNPSCINPRHLRWATVSDNHADKVKDGTDPVGERHGQAKITEDDVRAIRDDLRYDYLIAADYGISKTQVGRIKNRKRWTHVV